LTSPLYVADRVSLVASVGRGFVLNEISFTIQPGEFVGLLGPSGAGKTSLLRLMNRLSDPSAGTLRFQGTPIEQIPALELRRQVMLVGQTCRLLGMTVAEALHYPLQLQSMPQPQRQAAIATWLEKLQLPHDWLDRSELNLSGGQQQQVAIARALVTKPAVLLLDEPTSAQDLGAATRVLSAIQTEVKSRGLAVIMSNHQLELAQKFCDRILYLERGSLLKDQPATETDWQALRQSLVDADAQDRDDWGED